MQFSLSMLYGVLLEDIDNEVMDLFRLYNSMVAQDSMDLISSLPNPPPRPQPSGFRITRLALEALEPVDCLYRFRFYPDEIQRLVEVMEIPDPFIMKTRHNFSALEALCLLLARYSSAGNMFDLVIMYGRSQCAILEIVMELSTWIHERWDFLIGQLNGNHLLSPYNLESYAAAVHKAGAPLDSVFGFLDCTIRPICRPSRYQRQAYNGYKKEHALKYQALKLPNGMVGHLHGPEVGRHNDNYLLTQSGLLNWCAEHAFRPGTDESDPPEKRCLQVFSDPAYGIGLHILSPFSGIGERTEAQLQWNEAMARMQIEVEHGFGDIIRLWPFLNAWWKQQVFSAPLGIYYHIACLLTNARNCMCPGQTAQSFQCWPPSLEDYFHHEDNN